MPSYESLQEKEVMQIEDGVVEHMSEALTTNILLRSRSSSALGVQPWDSLRAERLASMYR